MTNIKQILNITSFESSINTSSKFHISRLYQIMEYFIILVLLGILGNSVSHLLLPSLYFRTIRASCESDVQLCCSLFGGRPGNRTLHGFPFFTDFGWAGASWAHTVYMVFFFRLLDLTHLTRSCIIAIWPLKFFNFCKKQYHLHNISVLDMV